MNNFKVLFFFEEKFLSLIEIKLNHLVGEKDKSKIFKWLAIDHNTGKVRKLDFISMNASGKEEQRVFRQGILNFDTNCATFETNNETISLQNKKTHLLPEFITKAIKSFLTA